MIRALAATSPSSRLEAFEYDPGDLAPDEVEIDVQYCGICHSDLSMLKNDWGMTAYPFVPGHEIVGTIGQRGSEVTHLEVGQTVGLGWTSRSCGICPECIGGDQNLCASAQGTIVQRHGGFANKVRSQALWVSPLPAGVDPASAGPLFCGGITVFNPILLNGVSPTDRVAVVGIGGLGSMALQFLKHWGCEVTAFSSPGKEEAARSLGAHQVLNSRDPGALESAVGSFDLILVTPNVALDWGGFINALRPKGTLHIVGATESITTPVFPMLMGQKSISASPTGAPGTISSMLEFAARHSIAPRTKILPMSQANEALETLGATQPAHRLVLQNDL